MLGYDWPRFHAAVNDLPAALLFTTVLFDVAAGLTKRASLQAAALWPLWAGFVGIIWTAVLGGKLVFEHAAGIPNATMQAEMTNRAAGHQHEPGEVDEHQSVGVDTVRSRGDTAKAAGHTHAPGTPPHKH